MEFSSIPFLTGVVSIEESNDFYISVRRIAKHSMGVDGANNKLDQDENWQWNNQREGEKDEST